MYTGTSHFPLLLYYMTLRRKFLYELENSFFLLSKNYFLIILYSDINKIYY